MKNIPCPLSNLQLISPFFEEIPSCPVGLSEGKTVILLRAKGRCHPERRLRTWHLQQGISEGEIVEMIIEDPRIRVQSEMLI